MPEITFIEIMRRALHEEYNSVLAEPLPPYWIDLIRRLDEESWRSQETETDRSENQPAFYEGVNADSKGRRG
jgi:hypothetical protein